MVGRDCGYMKTMHIGSSQLALDVLTGITMEYLGNVGQTFRFYLDKYSNMMTSAVCHNF